MRVAVVHHWFVSQGSGEKVAEALARMYPDADLFSLIVDPKYLPADLHKRTLHTSALNKLPFARRFHRHLLPFYPIAVEQLDLREYDLILTSDSGPMKGAIIGPSAVHICYCHAPMRYLWDQYHVYRSEMRLIPRLAFSASAHYVRCWDQLAAQRVTHFASNSRYVASRIRRYYGRESTVIYPPVDTASSYLAKDHHGAYLTVGRLVPCKRIDLLIEACNRLGRPLRIIGTGPEESRLRALAGRTIEFLGNVDHATLWNEYARCRAFLFAADEDFGMAVVEAQACGRPIIAFGRGGALESVVSLDKAATRLQCTGVFFHETTAMAAANAILHFEANEHRFDPGIIRAWTERFSTEVFCRNFRSLVDHALQCPAATREFQKTL
ncbi:glycosyltransferase [Paracidobacterium acidisoli]|uniref:Glycosyltransferase family 4 protein n=1 Tax=Paracidobacterium acidisoli TaxID=2303751 RepID=A0A372ILG5_9BACT|nr:glycosyltransferase [Paracidobacterium acidisoli]